MVVLVWFSLLGEREGKDPYCDVILSTSDLGDKVSNNSFVSSDGNKSLFRRESSRIASAAVENPMTT